MAVITGQKLSYDDRFNFSSKDEARFKSAHLTHDEYELYNEASMTRAQALSYVHKAKLGNTTLSTVCVAPYDRSALSICSRELKSLNGERKSDILLIVEHPLAIVPDECGPALPDQIVRAIGTQSGLRVVESDTSLASTTIIEAAIAAANKRGYTAEAVLGVAIHSVALRLNSRCTTDIVKGIHSVANTLGHDVDLPRLYHDAHRVSSYSPTQLTTLQTQLRRAIVAAGIVTEETNPRNVNLYDRSNLFAVLNEIPERGNDILGFLACQSAPNRVTPRTVQTVPACYEAWGFRFSAAQLHESALLMAKHLTCGTPGTDWGSNPLIRDIKTIIDNARSEAVERCVNLVVPAIQAPGRIVVVADPTTAGDFNSYIIDKLSYQ